MKKRVSLVLDTETTGLVPRDLYGRNRPYENTSLYDECRIVQICWIINDFDNDLVSRTYTILPDGFVIPEENSKIHGITHENAMENGVSIRYVMEKLCLDIQQYSPKRLVAHNLDFDYHVIMSELYRMTPIPTYLTGYLTTVKTVCTMLLGRDVCKMIPKDGFRSNINSKQFKNPKLSELYYFYFLEELDGAHSADVDTQACLRCYNRMRELAYLKKPGI